MSIEINGLGDPRTVGTADSNATAANTKTESSNPHAAHQGARTGDSIQLTDVAKQLQKLEAQLKDVPVVDVHRVDATRQAIANGNYEIHAGNVAQKLTQFEAYLPHR